MSTNTVSNQTWAAHFEKWRSSGLSAKVFCEQEGLVYNQFGYLRQKFLPADGSLNGSKLVPVTLAMPSKQTSDLEIEFLQHLLKKSALIMRS